VEVQAIYYGSNWSDNSATGQFEKYLNYLVQSPYLDMLTDAGYQVGRGSWDQGIVYSVNLPKGSNLLDSTIRNTLQSEISSGFLKNPDANRLYVIFVQPDVVVSNDNGGGSSSRYEPQGFVGYHNSFVGFDAFQNSAVIRYAIVVTPGGSYNQLSSTLPTFDQMTSIASHEIAEAVTDPDPNTGWFDRDRKQEIGDVYANDDVFLNHYVVQMQCDRNDNPIVPTTVTYEAAEFSGAGVWRFDSATGWHQLTSANATAVDADANGDVAAVIPGAGLWRFQDATGWQQLTPATPSLIGMSGRGYVAAVLPGYGIYRFEDGTGWQQLTAATASQVGVDLYGNVIAEIPGAGVWRYDDFHRWQQLTPTDANQVAIGANGVVAAAFSTYGVWRFDPARGWQQLTSAFVSSVGVDAVGSVAAEIPGAGVWRFKDGTGWQQLTTANATALTAGALSDLAAAFNGAGLWVFDDRLGWRLLTTATPYQFAIGA
jgi:hypothetical protein